MEGNDTGGFDSEEFDRFAGKILNTLILKDSNRVDDTNYGKLIDKSLEVTKSYAEARIRFIDKISKDKKKKK